MLPFKTRRTSQPQGGGIELDRASGWSHAILAGRLINGQAVSPYDPRPTPKGIANRVYMPAGTVSQLGIPKSASWSILFAGVLVNTGPYQYVLGCVGAANAIALALRHNSLSGRATFYDGATIKDSGINVVPGIYTTIGVTFDALTGTISWFKDGTLGLVQTGVVDVGGTGWQYCAQPGDYAETLQALLAFANKPLSSSAMLEATANPWQLFKPVSRSLWIPGTVSSGGTTSATVTAATGVAAGQTLTGTLTKAAALTAATGAATGQTLSSAAGSTVTATLTAATGVAVGQTLIATSTATSAITSATGTATAQTLTGQSLVSGSSAITAAAGTSIAQTLTATSTAASNITAAVGAATAQTLVGSNSVTYAVASMSAAGGTATAQTLVASSVASAMYVGAVGVGMGQVLVSNGVVITVTHHLSGQLIDNHLSGQLIGGSPYIAVLQN